MVTARVIINSQNPKTTQTPIKSRQVKYIVEYASGGILLGHEKDTLNNVDKPHTKCFIKKDSESWKGILYDIVYMKF